MTHTIDYFAADSVILSSTTKKKKKDDLNKILPFKSLYTCLFTKLLQEILKEMK